MDRISIKSSSGIKCALSYLVIQLWESLGVERRAGEWGTCLGLWHGAEGFEFQEGSKDSVNTPLGQGSVCPALGRAEIPALEMLLWALPGCHVWKMSWWQGWDTGEGSIHPQGSSPAPAVPLPCPLSPAGQLSAHSGDTAMVSSVTGL